MGLDSFEGRALIALVVVSGILALLIMVNVALIAKMKTRVLTMTSQLQAQADKSRTDDAPTLLAAKSGGKD